MFHHINIKNSSDCCSLSRLSRQRYLSPTKFLPSRLRKPFDSYVYVCVANGFEVIENEIRSMEETLFHL